MKDLILIKTLGTEDYYLLTCPVFHESRDKDLRDFKQDIKDAYESLTLQNCEAWFVNDINPKNFYKAKEEFFMECCAKYGLNRKEDLAANDDVCLADLTNDSTLKSIRLAYWGSGYTERHIVISFNKYNGYIGFSFRGVPESQAAEFLGMWIESCLNN